MSSEKREAQTNSPKQAHPVIYEGSIVRVFAINRSLLCSARIEDPGASEFAQKCTLSSVGATKCPAPLLKNCGSFFPKRSPAKEFIEETINDSEYTKLFTLLEHINQKRGIPWNREKFRDLTEVSYKGKNFLELKPTKEVRIGCFYEPGYQLYLTHGFHKKRGDWPDNQIQRLKEIYDDYLSIQQTLRAS